MIMHQKDPIIILNMLVEKIAYQFKRYYSSLKDGVPYSILKEEWERVQATQLEIEVIAVGMERDKRLFNRKPGNPGRT